MQDNNVVMYAQWIVVDDHGRTVNDTVHATQYAAQEQAATLTVLLRTALHCKAVS